jgi:hypothetical protein
MSLINKHHNWNYLVTNVPEALGDRYYTQDLIRDFVYLLHASNIVLKDITTKMPVLIRGGVVSKGTGDTLSVTSGWGYHYRLVKIPDSFAAFPPSVTSVDVAVRVSFPAKTDMAIPSAVLDGATTNYVKVAYAEADGNSRSRAKIAGSYAYEKVDSSSITVDTTPATSYEVQLCSFVGTAGGAFTITNATSFNLDNFIRSDIADTVSGVLTFNARPAFNGGVSGSTPPFTVDSTQLVSNLNAALHEGKTVQNIIDLVYPVGSFYVQYPDANSNTDSTAFPTSKRPATLFGGTWVEQWATENVFFKTRGTDGQTRTNGLSLDQLLDHQHWPVLSLNGQGSGNSIPQGTANSDSQRTSIQQGVVSSTTQKGDFTEPRNRLMKIWKRTA